MHETQQLLLGVGLDPADRIMFMASTRAKRPLAQGSSRPSKIAEDLNHPDLNVYVTTAVFGKRASRERGNVIGVSSICFDLDIKDDSFADQGAALKFVAVLSDIFETSPAFVVDTGGGLQPHWLLAGDDVRWAVDDDKTRQKWVSAFAAVGRMAIGIAAKDGIKLDDVYKIERLWRAPGTNNVKLETPRPSYILQDNTEVADELVYSDLIEAARAYTPAGATKKKTKSPKPQVALEPQAYQGWLVGALRGIKEDLENADVEGWDNTVTHVAFRLAGLGLAGWCPISAEDSEAFLQENSPVDAGFDTDKIQGKWESAMRKYETGEATLPEPPDLKAAELSRTGDEAGPNVTNGATALAWCREFLGGASSSRLYRYHNGIVYVTPEGEAHGLNKSGLAAQIMSDYECYRVVAGKDGSAVRKGNASFPTETAQQALAAPWLLSAMRPLAGIMHAPILRKNGTVLQTPGYDPATQLLYIPKQDFPVVPEKPTKRDEREAKAALHKITQGFPWVSPDDELNFLALLMTPLLRYSGYNTKIGYMRAHQHGSGKTLLAKIITKMYGGSLKPEWPREDIEMTKVLGTILDNPGGAVAGFDNIKGKAESSVLASLLTNEGEFTTRRLSTNTEIKAFNDRLWLLTGNNLAIGKELSRRTLVVSIDPNTPNPEKRTGFAIPSLIPYVDEHRGELVWALLVLLRRWYAAGAVHHKEHGDDFKEWSHIVEGTLKHAGYPGTFDNPATREDDREHAEEEWNTFLRGIYRVFQGKHFTLKELLAHVDPASDEANQGRAVMYDELPFDMTKDHKLHAETMQSLARTVANFCANRYGQWTHEGYAVVKAGVDRKKTNLLRVERSESGEG